MTKKMKMLGLLALAIGMVGNTTFAQSWKNALPENEKGLLVIANSATAELAKSLHTQNGYLVNCLFKDKQKVSELRKKLQETNLYGIGITSTHWTEESLPFIDNLVNVLVVDNISINEIDRVLAPYGIVFTSNSMETELKEKGYEITKFDNLIKAIKPYPKEMDEWTHSDYNASGTKTSQDEIVSPPENMQWSCGPRWARHHSIANFTSTISAGGRFFYMVDEAPIGLSSVKMPDKWKIIARDAFNGLKLWERKMVYMDWGSGKRDTPGRGAKYEGMGMDAGFYWWSFSRSNSVMIAIKDKVFTTLGFTQPLMMLNAKTGKTLKTYKDIINVDKTLFVNNQLLVKCDKGLVAIEPESGKILWKGTSGNSTVANEKQVCFISKTGIVSLDLKTGTQQWENIFPNNGKGLGTIFRCFMSLNDDLILCSGKERLSGKILAFQSKDGKFLWEKTVLKGGGNNMNGIWYHRAEGLIWYIGPADNRKSMLIGLDPYTGEEKKTYDVTLAFSSGHHQRCYEPKATKRFILGSKEGVEFAEYKTGYHQYNDWVRANCNSGLIPANGLLYMSPNSCLCFNDGMIEHFKVLGGKRIKIKLNDDFLDKGSEYGFKTIDNKENKWTTYRGNQIRSGYTNVNISETLTQLWENKLSEKITTPIIADNKVFIAKVNSHCLVALDQNTGKKIWSFICGGRIEIAPTYHKGMILFGSMNGNAYCLNASNGEKIWSFSPARTKTKMMFYDQLESSLPILTGIVIKENIAYFATGRSSFLDGGIFCYGLDILTGKVLYKNNIATSTLDPTKLKKLSQRIIGLKPDIMVLGKDNIYMKNLILPFDLNKYDLGKPNGKFSNKQYAGVPPSNNIFSSSSLSDDDLNHRVFWQKNNVTGSLLVFDDNLVYGVKVFEKLTKHMDPLFYPAKKGYLLFAQKPNNEKIKTALISNKPLPLETYKWYHYIPIRIKAMAVSNDKLFVAGPPDIIEDDDPLGAFEGRKGGLLYVYSKTDGKKLAEYKLDSPPVWNGMAIVENNLFISLRNGTIINMGDND